MAIRKIIQLVCDRCGKKEEHTEEPETTGVAVFSLTTNGELGQEEINLMDLCKRCTDRLKVLVSQIKMEREAKKEREPSPESV